MSEPGSRIFYGWWITGASFLILFITVGIGLYCPPVFLARLQEEFGWSRAAITLGTSIAALVGGLASPLVGVWIDRFGSRPVMAAGALVMGIGFALFGLMQSLWHLYALNVVVSVGLSCVAWLPNQTLIASWFESRRGLAMGISVAGIGFGGLTMATVAGLLIEAAGWRVSFATLGGLVLTIVVSVILAVIRTRPADLGLAPDGAVPASGVAGDASDAPLPGLEVGQALRTRAFGLLAVLHFLWVFANLSVIAHLPAFLEDQGFARNVASFSLGFAVGASVIGRLIFGSLADRFSKRTLMCLALLLHGASVLFLFRIHATAALPVFLTLFGVALGGGAVMIPLIVGECFGLRAFGKTLGLVMIPATLGAAVGPVLTGWIFDVNGSYAVAFILHIASFTLAALLALRVRRPEGW